MMHGHRFATIFPVLFLFLVLFLGPVAVSDTLAAGERPPHDLFDRHGLTLMHGRSTWSNVGPDPEVNYQWTTAAYLIAWDLSSWFSIETQAGAGYLKSDDRGDSPSAELRLLADLHVKWLFLKLGFGVAHIFDPEDLPGLAESKAHSIVSGAAGFRFPFTAGGFGPMELSLAYGVEHISAISKDGSEGDTGWNTGGPRLVLTWYF